MEDLFEIGIITGTHGLKGTLRVFPTTGSPERFSCVDSVIIEHKGVQKTHKVLKTAFHKKFVLISTEGITDIDSAAELKGGRIMVTRSNAVPLDKNEYYAKDLYEMAVFTESGEELGILSDIIATGANDVYVVKSPNGSEILIPAIKQCIISVDTVERKMTVRLLEGLREL